MNSVAIWKFLEMKLAISSLEKCIRKGYSASEKGKKTKPTVTRIIAIARSLSLAMKTTNLGNSLHNTKGSNPKEEFMLSILNNV